MSSAFRRGVFCISLDFELHWGVSECRSVADYSQNLDNTADAILKTLDLFASEGIHATWATVGLLFCKNKAEITEAVPENLRPQYANSRLSTFELLSEVGQSEADAPFHFAGNLIDTIKKTPGQEIGSHTFSHYYCLEQSLTENAFEADVSAACKVANRKRIALTSMVFPRNQYDDNSLRQCVKHGFDTFRGNERSWVYRPKPRHRESATLRIVRLMDNYVKLSGDNTHSLDDVRSTVPFNVAASRFLRPYSPAAAPLDWLRRRRICREMRYAAATNRLYHLWWHPHNFGKHQDASFKFLRAILRQFKELHERFGMQSLNMREIGEIASDSGSS